MKKSHVSFIIAAALAAALLAGCGSSGSSADASGSGKAGGQTRGTGGGKPRMELTAGLRERFSGEITFWHSFYPGAKTGDHPEGGGQIHGREPGCENQYLRRSHGMTFYTKWTYRTCIRQCT